MRQFNQRNLLADKIHLANAPQSVTGMGMESSAGQLVKELAKIVGLAILGGGVGWVIGTVLNKIFHGKQSSARLEIKFNKIRESYWGKEHIVDRERLVAEMERRASPVIYLLQDCVNEGDLWSSAVELVSPVGGWKGDPVDFTIDIDKLYVGLDERTFVNKANELITRVVSDAWTSQAQLGNLTGALKKAGAKLTHPLMYKSMSLAQMTEATDHLAEIFSTWAEIGGGASSVEKLSRRGQFKLGQFIGNAGDMIKSNDKKIAEAEKNLVAIKRFNIDKADVQEFLKKDPAFSEVNDRLLAALKMMGTIDKVRLEVMATVMRVIEAILNLLNGMPGGLDNTTTKIGTESLFDESALLARFPEGVSGMGLESIDGGMNVRCVYGTAEDQLMLENGIVLDTVLNLGTLAIRASGIHAMMGEVGEFNDSDVVGLLAARIQNYKKL